MVGDDVYGVKRSDYLCHLKSFDADGFTVGVDQNIKNDGATQHFLALKDPSTSFKVGVATQKTSAGTKAITGVGFRPGAGLFFSSPQTSPNVKNTTVGPQFSYGGTDHFKTDQASELFTSTPTSTTPYQNQRMVQGKLLSFSQLNTTTLAEASMSSYDADGFTLNWTTADAVARYFIYGVWESLLGPWPCDGEVTSMYTRFNE
jgi:hypothetical protein